MKKMLEICCGNIESVVNAVKGGADRIELCSAPDTGGVTPSAGLIKEAVKISPVPVNVLIRPREGNFCYHENEIKIMLHDIEFCRNSGVAGVVFGALTPEGNVDINLCQRLSEAAKPLRCTFHRAFDVTYDAFRALEDIIQLGFDCLLTSGQKVTAEEGLELIARLSQIAGSRIRIMPGGGIHLHNLQKIVRNSGADDFHMSLRKPRHPLSPENSTVNFSPAGISDWQAIRKAKEILVNENL